MSSKNYARYFSAILAAMLYVCDIPAQAQAQTSVSGVISGVYLSGPSNFAFRISLNNINISGCNAGFLYVNATNGNYQAYVAMLLSDYAQQKRVTIYYATDANGYCAMGDIMG